MANNLEIPEDAVELATIAWYEATPGVSWADAGKYERAAMLSRSKLILEAALPHLRVQESPTSELEVVHLIDDDEGITSCCGRTPFDLARTDRITSDPTLARGCGRPAAVFAPCQTAKEWGECVLANGHETWESGDVGWKPMTAHVDRHGQHWGVYANGGNIR